ncbi:MAG: peptidylprolyl isomerase [Marmoricola sp.]|nr:peptidylprolyl isomerase [Marmoricola sp.]
MRRLPALALTVATALALAGCTSSNDPTDPGSSGVGPLPGVVVTGKVGEPPTITFKTPLKLDESRSKVLDQGTGSPIISDQLFVLELTLVDGRTGKKVISTYDQGRSAVAVKESDANLFPVLLKALTGQKQGSRIVVEATAADAYGDNGAPQYDILPGDPIVIVADVLAVPPTTILPSAAGRVVPARKGIPTVVLTDGHVSRLNFAHATKSKPKHLVVIPLIEGTGPPARANSLVTLNYLGQLYGTDKVFDQTFSKEPATIPLGTDGVIEAWDRALVGVPRGSRVLVLTPPRLAFKATGSPPGIPGNATLAYVIDVLGVS